MAINDILVRDLSLPSRVSDFRVTAANPLLNQTGVLSARNIMNQPGVTNIEGSLIPGDRPIPSYENYEDLIMNPDFMPNRLQNLERFADNRFEDSEEIPGFNFIDAPTSLKSRITNPQFLNNPNRGIIDNLILSRGNPDASLVNKTKNAFKNIAQFLPFGEKSITGSLLRGITSLLPERDPRQKALEDFYGNIKDGTIQSGLMAGYNPVSGGLLNMLTGGKMGEETTYGLSGAIDKRMARIQKTLAKQRKDKKRQESEVLKQRLKDLQALKDREAKALEASRAASRLQDARRDAINNPKSLYDSGSNYRSIDSSGNKVSSSSAQGTTTFDSKSGKGRRDY